MVGNRYMRQMAPPNTEVGDAEGTEAACEPATHPLCGPSTALLTVPLKRMRAFKPRPTGGTESGCSSPATCNLLIPGCGMNSGVQGRGRGGCQSPNPRQHDKEWNEGEMPPYPFAWSITNSTCWHKAWHSDTWQGGDNRGAWL